MPTRPPARVFIALGIGIGVPGEMLLGWGFWIFEEVLGARDLQASGSGLAPWISVDSLGLEETQHSVRDIEKEGFP